MVSFAHELRAVVEVSESSYGQISEGVVVRRIMLLGYESPSVPASEVPLVEGHPVIVQEIGRTASSRRGPCGFCDDSITFHVRYSRISYRYEYVPHLSEEPAERPEGLGHSELHLADVTRLMDGKHGAPWNRLGIICRRKCEKVHPFRGPCDRTVRRIVCMKHDGHLSSVSLS